MPHSDKLKTRLPYWNLFFLALILSGGGFFWYANYQQQLVSRLDSQLFAAAEYIDFFSDKIAGEKSGQQILCENMTGLRAVAKEVSFLAVYSPTGSLLCFSGSNITDNRMLLAQNVPLSPEPALSVVNNRQGAFRQLIYPLENIQTPTILTIHSDLKGIKTRLSIFSSILFLAGISIITSFSILQRKLRSRNLTAMRRLARLMDRTNADSRPQTFEVTETVGPEALDLAQSYNALMNRIADSLLRSRQFAANVTHELRTPLTILRGETELALRNAREQDQLRQVLESNLEEISRMSYLIEDLLLLSKSDLGEIPLKMEALDLTGLALELHHQTQLLANAKNISVQLQTPEEQVIIQADSLRLRQVLLNLLTNAIKYTPDNGEISISLEANDEKVEIAISDTGMGIGSEHLEKIFERFYRINKTHNRNDGGSGLGLAIVKWIVDAHRGMIKVSSIPGQGSKFSISLPLSEKFHASEPVSDS